jgi:putative nucleotidyltransferase with HDIG domain
MLTHADDRRSDAAQVEEILLSALAGGEFVVPALSAGVVRLVDLCREPEYSVQAVVDVIRREPALAGQVLRVVNSAVYAPKVPIDSITQAVARLGGRALSEVALAMLVKEQVFRPDSRHATRMHELWLHSSAAGIYAFEIGRVLGDDGEIGLLAGLLHDVGRPVVMGLLDDLDTLIGAPLDAQIRRDVEDELHAEVGALVLREWGLPGPLEYAVAMHHRPFSPGQHRDLALVAHLADELAHWAADADGRSPGAIREHLAFSTLGIDSARVDELLGDPERVLFLAANL